MPEITHEYNDRGAHRLIVDGEKSEWFGYQSFIEFKEYMAFTGYYGERVIKIEKIITDYKEDNVCSVCEKSNGWDGVKGLFPKDTCEHMLKRYPTLISKEN